MFNYKEMIKRAVEFFPLWTDIRKRYNKSLGGNFITSIIEKEIEVEEAIQEYIDSYFLYNYIDHEDDVMSYAYMTTIGQLSSLEGVQIFYNKKEFTFAETISEFETIEKTTFYENGYLYIKESDHIDGLDEITVSIDTINSVYKIKRVHIWNIFDEFATFVNTRRYKNETNKQLLDRILYITRNLPNGTESGLKHAIISELMTDFPDLTEEEIIIERPTPNNLIKPYEDYEMLLELLAEINRDVYRTKRWDLDYWEYDFESISYIPHMWDKAIYEWQNGVGSYEDLEVIISDNNQNTDVTLYLYKKTLEAFQKYVHDKHINGTVNFTLKKYNDILNKTNIKYKITASELVEITNENIKLALYESKRRKDTLPVQDILIGWGKDIEKINNNIITDLDPYRLEFKSANNYDLTISQAKVYYSNRDTGEIVEALDLMEERNNFVMNADYELVSEANKQSVTAIEHFTYVDGIVNEDDHMIIAPGKSKATGVLSLTNRAGLYLTLDYECDTVDLPTSLIRDYSGYWRTNNGINEFIVRGDYSTESKTISFSVESNYVSFSISNDENYDSQILLELTDGDNVIEHDLSHAMFFETETTSNPRMLTFKLSIISPNDVKFSNFKYNNYAIKLNTKYGELEYIDGRYKLPNFYNNELTLNIETKSAESIIVKGIYIGEDFFNVKYITNLIPAKNNCDRIFEIKTNGIMNLLRYDNNGILIKETENYQPIISYKGISDEALIRIDLADYDSITTIHPDAGTIEAVEENGKLFYNIRLKANEIVNKVEVAGTKTYSAREVVLEDMIKFYIPDYNNTNDKIYCSKCSNGLIISRRNPGGTPYNELITIGSEIFAGIKIVKYVAIVPSYIGTIYGSNNGYENRSNTSVSNFDYISFYPAQAQLYHAINEYDTYLSENKFIPIVNNFAPILNTSKLLFYKVEKFDTEQNDNIIIRFHNNQNANLDIKDMPNWSIGTNSSFVAIKNEIDLLNNATYDMTTYNLNEYVYLSNNVEIKDSYTITNHTILNTERFMISTDDENVSIKYDYYNGTEKKSHLLKYENIFIESDGFNKLVYSNIDTIYHCSFSPFEGEYINEIPFEILKDQGIIIWQDPDIINKNLKVYLVYSIRKPIAFVFDLEYLYKAIEYNVEAYDEIGQYTIKNQKNGESINLLTSTAIDDDIKEKYQDCDLIKASCSNPTFEARYEDDEISLHKYIEEDTILIKSGYYYINGKEYYLYSKDNNAEDVKNNSYYTSENIDISGGEITTYKETNNYLSNSEMRLKGIANLYSYNCNNDLIYGISSLNNITSCESFNEWSTFEMNIRLVEGLNGLGLQFIPTLSTGYAFIDITDSLVNNELNYISFYASKELQVYLGKEQKYLDINFNRAINIKIDQEILYENSDIRYTSITKEPNERYYIVVQNSGIIDDIIVSTDMGSIYKSHIKNISLLGLDLYERKSEGTRYRMILRNNKDYKSFKAALMSNGYIKTTSSLDWYITKLKSYVNDEDFKACELMNVGVNANCIFTTNNDGYIETQAIKLGDLDNIKRIIVKINDVEINPMSGFSSFVYTSDNESGNYISCCGTQYDNKFNVTNEFLRSYIKIRINMPMYKYINNITVFVEYFSTNENPMPIITTQTGYIESKIYDLQQESNCVVRSIDIEDISNINDIDIYIRSSRDSERLDVWSNWKKIQIDDGLNIINAVNFLNTRFLQYKIVIKNRSGYIKFKNIDVEIK